VPDVAEHFETPDEWSTKFLDWQVSRAWSEDRLSVRERAIMALTSDVGLGVLDESFRAHVRLALDAGLGEDDVRDVVRFCAEYGVARGAAAVRELESVLSTG
jgi:alkylhydroperoxidase/carboxymuconolactone decarboxylase family protein YurZ